MSLYTARVPGAASSATRIAAAVTASRPCASRYSLRCAGSPEECASSIRTVTASRHSRCGLTPFANSGSNSATFASSPSFPRSHSSIAIEVVAIALVSDARSHTVSRFASGELAA